MEQSRQDPDGISVAASTAGYGERPLPTSIRLVSRTTRQCDQGCFVISALETERDNLRIS
eukprot:2547476-Pleurochrysis_carterae.AAC.6